MMKCFANCIVAAAILASPTAFADVYQTYDFTFNDPNAGNLVSSGTLYVDTTTGTVLSGSGSINSTLFHASDGVTLLGTQSMSLVTSSNRGQNNVDGLGGFLWTDTDGTNLTGDTNFSASAPYVDSDGLIFLVGTPVQGSGSVTGLTGSSFNFWYQGGQLYGDFLGAGGAPGGTQVYQENLTGTFTVMAVPEPATCALMLAGLGALGFAARRRRSA
jgi:hypothetical protein